MSILSGRRTVTCMQEPQVVIAPIDPWPLVRQEQHYHLLHNQHLVLPLYDDLVYTFQNIAIDELLSFGTNQMSYWSRWMP